jgi:ATP-dependent Clp protease ATP-binding subunit ClpC
LNDIYEKLKDMSVDFFNDDEKTVRGKKNTTGSKTPVLDNFSKDLSKLAETGKLDMTIGREKEIKRLAQILSRRKKNNPLILGDPGSGKTNLIEGVALMISKGEGPQNLLGKRIVNLDLTSVVAGTKYRGQFEERMKVIIQELTENPNVIIFIDEIHTLIGSGNSSNSMDGANIFKPALASGDIQCIGATTFEEYKKSIEKDGALARRFQKIKIDQPSISETIKIIKQSIDKYESFHKSIYSDEIIELCVRLADRYITDRAFPDKAFDVVDEVGAKQQIDVKIPESIKKLKEKITELKQEKTRVVINQEYELAAEIRDKELKLLTKLDVETKKFEEDNIKNKRIVDLEDVYAVVSTMTNIPMEQLNLDEKQKLINIDKKIKDNVIGQDQAVDSIVKAIKRNRLNIKDPNRPIGSFICLGSTGVGKTHLAKQLAKQLFGNEKALIRIDMSEYQEKHTISRLIGSPPGYVSHDEGGQLTEKVKNNPYSVILFDEIEKAHKDVFHLLLQILDDGHLTDAMGKTINFKNTIIILTSNLGIKKFSDFGAGISFTSSKYGNEEAKKSMLMAELKKFFSPEFLNRIDDTVVFNTLTDENVKKITRIELNKLIDRLKESKYNFTYDDSVVDLISKIGFDETYGARPIKRAIQDKIEDLISDEVLNDVVKEGGKYQLTTKDENVILN